VTKSPTAKAAKGAKERNGLTAKDAKDAKKSIINTKGAKTTPSGVRGTLQEYQSSVLLYQQ
jgi:hypothetical protein